jgi:co-chaperonin GroES (HSP10)
MDFKPFNKHLWILPQEEKVNKESPLFVMPDEYQPPKSPYVIGDIIGMSDDCTIDLDIGDRIVVERTTIQEIKANSETIYVVKENYVYGRLYDEADE